MPVHISDYCAFVFLSLNADKCKNLMKIPTKSISLVKNLMYQT